MIYLFYLCFPLLAINWVIKYFSCYNDVSSLHGCHSIPCKGLLTASPAYMLDKVQIMQRRQWRKYHSTHSELSKFRVMLTSIAQRYLEYIIFGFFCGYIWSLFHVLFFGVVYEVPEVNFHQGTRNWEVSVSALPVHGQSAEGQLMVALLSAQ